MYTDGWPATPCRLFDFRTQRRLVVSKSQWITLLMYRYWYGAVHEMVIRDFRPVPRKLPDDS